MSENVLAIKPEVEAFKEAARNLGLNQKVTNALLKRLEQPVNGNKKYSPKELLEQLDLKIALGLDYMDDLAFASASLKELSISMGILIEKRQLLQGQPTQIMSHQEVKELDELIPALYEECKRRGLTIEATPIHHDDEEPVDVLPPPTA